MGIDLLKKLLPEVLCRIELLDRSEITQASEPYPNYFQAGCEHEARHYHHLKCCSSARLSIDDNQRITRLKVFHAPCIRVILEF
jgi:hypothetical protein